MSQTIEGILKVVMPFKQVSEKFSKQEFVITTEDTYPQTIIFQLINSLTAKINPFQIGEKLRVTFNINGKPWKNPSTGEEKYFTSLNAFKIDLLAGVDPSLNREPEHDPYNNDDLKPAHNTNPIIPTDLDPLPF